MWFLKWRRKTCMNSWGSGNDTQLVVSTSHVSTATACAHLHTEERWQPLPERLSSCCVLCRAVLNRVQLFAAAWTVAHQDPLSIGLFRQEYWSRLQFPSPGESSPPRDRTRISPVSCIVRWVLYHWAIWEAPARAYVFWIQSPRICLNI